MANLKVITSKLERAMEIATQLKAQKFQAEALEKEKMRKKIAGCDARRKMLIGAIVLRQWRDGNLPTENLMNLIGSHLKLEADRLLFTEPTDGANRPHA